MLLYLNEYLHFQSLCYHTRFQELHKGFYLDRGAITLQFPVLLTQVMHFPILVHFCDW